MLDRRARDREAARNLEKERAWNGTFALKQRESRAWKQMSTDIKALVTNSAPYMGMFPRTGNTLFIRPVHPSSLLSPHLSLKSRC